MIGGQYQNYILIIHTYIHPHSTYRHGFVTCPLWSEEVEILDVFSEGFDILVDCIWCHTPNLHQPVVLDEYCVTGQVAVDYWGVATEEKFLSFGQTS